MRFKGVLRVLLHTDFSRNATRIHVSTGLGVRRSPESLPKEEKMLSWSLAFLVIAIIAAIFGFGGIAGSAASIAQVLFFVFLVVFAISLVFSLVTGRRGRGPLP